MSDDKKVVDFNEKRKKTIEQKRRNFERVVFQEFLGVETVVDSHGSGHPIKLLDVSNTGCQLQLPFSPNAKNQFSSGTELTLKFYFTKQTYLSAIVVVRHTSEYVDSKGDVWLRLGGEFDTSLPSFNALRSFIDFIYQYAEYSHVDKGEGKVYFL
jgi:hypothetical protein